MDDVMTAALPLLPLPDGVVAPQMVVNLVVDSAPAHAAIDAARRRDGRLILVPRLDGRRYAKVGTVALVEQDERAANGTRAVLIRGLERATIGAGRGDERGGLQVAYETAEPYDSDPQRTAQLAREYRAVLDEILEHRRARGVAAAIAEITDPGALADTALYSPDLSVERRIEVLERTA